jgi:hypothetical protein
VKYKQGGLESDTNTFYSTYIAQRSKNLQFFGFHFQFVKRQVSQSIEQSTQVMTNAKWVEGRTGWGEVNWR